MIPSTVSKLPEWRNLYEHLTTAAIGDVLAHDVAATVMRCPYGTLRYFTQINRWRREEQNGRNRQWRTLRKIGYELVAASEHPLVASTKLDRATRSTRRAFAIMQHTTLEDLTDSQRQKHVNAEARIGVLLQIVTGTKKEVRQLYLPQQPPKPTQLA